MKKKNNNRTVKPLLPLLLSAMMLASCGSEGDDAGSVQEQLLALGASSTYITLSEDHIDDIALTFTWTPAREPGSDFSLSYLTKLDLADNNFSACVKEEEEDGVFSKSFTHGQLQKLLVNNWHQAVNREVLMTFRVIGTIAGPRFVRPEVADLDFTVRTYGPQVIQAAGLRMAGSAVPSGAAPGRTLENQYVFAYRGQLKAGTLYFPINQDGETAICPAGSEASAVPIDDGQAMEVRVKTAAEAELAPWTIPADGIYRVVVDLENKTVAIYSAATDIRPVEVPATSTATTPTPVTAIYAYGEPTGWAWSDTYAFVQSTANPNIWIFNTRAIGGRTKFGVIKSNDSFVYSCAPTDTETGKDVDVVVDTPVPLTGGTSRGQRNSYLKIPSGTNFIVLNLNTMTATFSVK
ncbi:MAG: SusE domain-containing protein [Dysgonamonadaceae bacterium]|jgi:hypothetical protein|nr:SusE domain-containing protein [Dysgonamonadaceae bacterium]